jgi:Flp pilus assembly protein CpaB
VTSNEASGPNDRTRTVLQNVEVLAVQTALESTRDEPQRADVITLLVSPSDAERLAAAIRIGTLQLAMRSYGDQQAISTQGVSSRELLGLPASAPEQVQPVQRPMAIALHRTETPWPRMSVEIIRDGKRRQTVDFTRTRSLATNTDMTSAADPPASYPGATAQVQ